MLDIRAQTEDGRQLNVEMQMINTSNFIHRTLYYWSELYGENLHAGDDYLTLSRTITINLLNFKLFQRSRMTSLYQLRDDQDHELLTDLMQIYFIELPKLDKQPLPPRLQQWLQFITIDDRKELNALANANPAIGEAYKMLNYISQDSEERMQHLRRKLALMDKKAFERDVLEAQELKVQLKLQAEELHAKGEELNAKGEELHAKDEELNAKADELRAKETLQNQRIEKAHKTLLNATAILLAQRFGPLPSWAEERLAAATFEQLEAIDEKIPTAACLECCFH